MAGVGLDRGAEDLQNTLTHEFGHLLGLDHNCFLPGTRARGVDNRGVAVPDCDRAPPEVQEATMFAAVSRGDVLRRTLAADDIAGVCALYPAAPGGPACVATDLGLGGGSSGGCSYGGTPAAGLSIVLLGGAWLLSARRRRAQPRG